MNKRERVQAAFEGRRVDRIPFTMWRPLYFQCQTVSGLAQTALRFYREYDPDMIVLAPGPFYMAESWGADIRSFSTDDMAPYIVAPSVDQVTAWRSLPELDVKTCSLAREIEAVRQIRAELGDEDVPLVVPLYSPLDTANMLCDGRIAQDVRSFSNDLRAGLRTIGLVTSQFARECLRAGADGFLLIAGLASADRLRGREYRDFGQQYDLMILNELSDAAIRILLLEGEHLFFDLADRYPVQAVCWETWRSDPSLAGASRQVRCALMGGINPTAFVSGSANDIRGQIADAIAQTGGWRFMLSPSGPLSPGAKPELMASVRTLIQG